MIWPFKKTAPPKKELWHRTNERAWFAAETAGDYEYQYLAEKWVRFPDGEERWLPLPEGPFQPYTVRRTIKREATGIPRPPVIPALPNDNTVLCQ